MGQARNRMWVVWGLTAPEGPDGGLPAPPLAVRMAELADPEFAAADPVHRWIRLVEGDEDDVDAWVRAQGEVSAYAEYVLDAPD